MGAEAPGRRHADPAGLATGRRARACRVRGAQRAAYARHISISAVYHPQPVAGVVRLALSVTADGPAQSRQARSGCRNRRDLLAYVRAFIRSSGALPDQPALAGRIAMNRTWGKPMPVERMRLQQRCLRGEGPCRSWPLAHHGSVRIRVCSSDAVDSLRRARRNPGSCLPSGAHPNGRRGSSIRAAAPTPSHVLDSST